MSCHPSFFPTDIRPREQAEARHNREYVPLEMESLGTGEPLDEPHPEFAWANHLLERHRLHQTYRGDDIYALSRKTRTRKTTLARLALRMSCHPSFFPTDIRPREQAEARHNREYVPLEMESLGTGEPLDEPHPEFAWANHLLERHRLHQTYRGDDIYALSRKTRTRKTTLARLALRMSCHPSFFPTDIRPREQAEARHNREYVPLEMESLGTGEPLDEPHPEFAWVIQLLERHQLHQTYRGDDIYA